MALISTLTDNFNDNSIAAQWGTYTEGAGAIAEQNQQLEISVTTTADYAELNSDNLFDLVASQVTLKIVDITGSTNNNAGYLNLRKNYSTDNQLTWRILAGGAIAARKTVATVSSDLATATYVAATHRYLRIREASGTIYWDYSADGISWTNFASATVASTFAVGDMQVAITDYNNAAVAGTFKVDNFNLLPTLTDATKTKLLCHFDGADGATTYTSDDANARTATFAGSAQLDTAIKEAGTASLLLASATSDYLTFPDSDDWAFGTDDFTIDGQLYFNSLPAASSYFTPIAQAVDADNRWRIQIYNNAGTYQITFRVNDGGVQTINPIFSLPSLATGIYYHFAITRSIGIFYLLWQGSLLGSDNSVTGVSIPNLAAVLTIGQSGLSTLYFNGQTDELRIVKGTAIWTANFTPPVEYYMSSENIRFFIGVSP